MSRFLFYLILVNMLANVISLTPRVLVAGNDNGTILSLILVLPVIIVVSYIIISLFRNFPGLGLPEILKMYTPKWIVTPVLLFFSASWYFAGLISLIIYTSIIIRFVTPDMPISVILLTFVLVITFGILMTSRNILYLTEIIFLITIPFIAFILIKGYSNFYFQWDYVGVAVMHINHLPDYAAFTSSLYISIGIANLVIFNRFFTTLKKPNWKGMALLTAICTFLLLSTYFIPVGLGGFDSLDNVLYPWIMTSDSMRLKYGVIERVVFFFIGVFLVLSVVSITMLWHVSLQLLIGSIQFKRFKWKGYNLTTPIYIVCFWAIAMYVITKISLDELYKSFRIFNEYFLLFIVLLLIGCLLLAKKGAASKWPESKK